MKHYFDRSVEVGALTVAVLMIPGGLALLVFTLHRAKEAAPGVTLMEIPAAGLVLVIGLIAVVVGVIERALTKDIWAAQNRFPAEPWRWWKGWREGAIHPAFPRLVLVAALVASLLLGCVTIGYVADRSKPGAAGLNTPQLLLIIAACLLVLAWAGRRFASWMRHRRVLFRATTFPGVIGRTLEGVVCFPPGSQLGNEVGLRLRCVVIDYRAGAGGREERNETTRWEAERRFNPALLSGDIAAQGLPVYFRIPPDLPPSTPIPRRPHTVWRLQVKVPTSRSNFATKFEVPVFALPAGSSDSAGADPLAIAEIRD